MLNDGSRGNALGNGLTVMCFLPDAGHVLPLLRLARRLQGPAQRPVTCFAPPRFATTIHQYGFDYQEVRTPGAWSASGLGAALARRSVFYNAFSGYVDLADNYWAPLRASVSEQLGELLPAIQRLRSATILCDSHLFLDWYRAIAAACGADLIVNYSEGTLRRLQRPYVQAYGLTDKPRALQASVELAGRAATLWFRGWRGLRHARRRRLANSLNQEAAQRADAVFRHFLAAKPPQVTYVSAGVAVLEGSLDGVRRPTQSAGEILLAPTIAEEDRLSDGLRTWLQDQKPGSVVYVSFGTMVSLSAPMARALVLGLTDARMPVIWSLPAAQRDILAGYPLPADFRIEDFVAQRALLSSDQVACFVTHGGAGSTQEALMFGKPVLCIPFMWDQPYNCSVLQRLGVARRLSKGSMTRQRVAAEVTELTVNPRYAEAARHHAHSLAGLQKADNARELLGGTR